MIVWSGRGYLAIVVLVVLIFVMHKIFPEVHEEYGFASAFLVTGIFSWFAGNKWNNKDEKTVIDKASGKEIILKGNHSLFWIKMQYWGYIFSALAITFVVKGFA